MYLSKIMVSPRDDVEPSTLAALADPYGCHRYVWERFPGHHEHRPFLYRADLRDRSHELMILSDEKPLAPGSGAGWATRRFEPKLRNGDELVFSLRVNPVVSKIEGDAKRGKRHDAIMAAKRDLQESGETVHMPDLIQREGVRWLSRRAERLGFELVSRSVRSDAYTQHVVSRGDERRPIRFSTVDIDGRLRVIDPDLFLDTLRNGIGPQKSMGCGLLLIRRA